MGSLGIFCSEEEALATIRRKEVLGKEISVPPSSHGDCIILVKGTTWENIQKRGPTQGSGRTGGEKRGKKKKEREGDVHCPKIPTGFSSHVTCVWYNISHVAGEHEDCGGRKRRVGRGV